MLLSVIIPTFNRNDLLRNCLDLLCRDVQQLSEEFYEVIITDDGKNNEAKDLIERDYASLVKWVEGPKKGPASNRNNGAKYAKGDWIIFLDDDCLPSIHLLKNYTNAICSYKDMLAFEGRIFVDTKPKSLLDQAPLNEKGGCFWSCNIALQKQFFFDLGMFDEGFQYASMEDVDLFYRIRQKTKKFMFLYDASVMHPWRRNNNIVRYSVQHYQSIIFYVKKHPEEKERLNTKALLISFIKSRPTTLKLALNSRFNGFWQKLQADIVWVYLIIRL